MRHNNPLWSHSTEGTVEGRERERKINATVTSSAPSDKYFTTEIVFIAGVWHAWRWRTATEQARTKSFVCSCWFVCVCILTVLIVAPVVSSWPWRPLLLPHFSGAAVLVAAWPWRRWWRWSSTGFLSAAPKHDHTHPHKQTNTQTTKPGAGDAVLAGYPRNMLRRNGWVSDSSTHTHSS